MNARTVARMPWCGKKGRPSAWHADGSDERKMTYEIEFITDTRFGETRQKLQSMDKQLKREMSKLSCVSLEEVTGIRRIQFSGDEPCTQWRKKYRISKSCRETTWDDVMEKINKIQAPFYKEIGKR